MKNGVKIKICGMREEQNLRDIAAFRPDLFGFIFYPGSPRYVSPEQAATLPEFSGISRAGVFVNEETETVLEIARQTRLSGVQLHGNEPPGFCEAIKKGNAKLNLIKVFSVGEDFDGKVLTDYEMDCDYFLFDTQTPKHGGSGKSFDWNILRSFPINKPFFLSGGIGAENINEAIGACAGLPLFAVDLNSRVEISPGLKSPQIIEEIIRSI